MSRKLVREEVKLVLDLLDQWDLPQLKKKFEEEEVSLTTLLCIEDDDKHLPDIIPKVGTRIVFKYCLKKWKAAQTKNSIIEVEDAGKSRPEKTKSSLKTKSKNESLSEVILNPKRKKENNEHTNKPRIQGIDEGKQEQPSCSKQITKLLKHNKVKETLVKEQPKITANKPSTNPKRKKENNDHSNKPRTRGIDEVKQEQPSCSKQITKLLKHNNVKETLVKEQHKITENKPSTNPKSKTLQQKKHADIEQQKAVEKAKEVKIRKRSHSKESAGSNGKEERLNNDSDSKQKFWSTGKRIEKQNKQNEDLPKVLTNEQNNEQQKLLGRRCSKRRLERSTSTNEVPKRQVLVEVTAEKDKISTATVITGEASKHLLEQPAALAKKDVNNETIKQKMSKKSVIDDPMSDKRTVDESQVFKALKSNEKDSKSLKMTFIRSNSKESSNDQQGDQQQVLGKRKSDAQQHTAVKKQLHDLDSRRAAALEDLQRAEFEKAHASFENVDQNVNTMDNDNCDLKAPTQPLKIKFRRSTLCPLDDDGDKCRQFWQTEQEFYKRLNETHQHQNTEPNVADHKKSAGANSYTEISKQKKTPSKENQIENTYKNKNKQEFHDAVQPNIPIVEDEDFEAILCITAEAADKHEIESIPIVGSSKTDILQTETIEQSSNVGPKNKVQILEVVTIPASNSAQQIFETTMEHLQNLQHTNSLAITSQIQQQPNHESSESSEIQRNEIAKDLVALGEVNGSQLKPLSVKTPKNGPKCNRVISKSTENIKKTKAITADSLITEVSTQRTFDNANPKNVVRQISDKLKIVSVVQNVDYNAISQANCAKSRSPSGKKGKNNCDKRANEDEDKTYSKHKSNSSKRSSDGNANSDQTAKSTITAVKHKLSQYGTLLQATDSDIVVNKLAAYNTNELSQHETSLYEPTASKHKKSSDRASSDSDQASKNAFGTISHQLSRHNTILQAAPTDKRSNDNKVSDDAADDDIVECDAVGTNNTLSAILQHETSLQKSRASAKDDSDQANNSILDTISHQPLRCNSSMQAAPASEQSSDNKVCSDVAAKNTHKTGSSVLVTSSDLTTNNTISTNKVSLQQTTVSKHQKSSNKQHSCNDSGKTTNDAFDTISQQITSCGTAVQAATTNKRCGDDQQLHHKHRTLLKDSAKNNPQPSLLDQSKEKDNNFEEISKISSTANHFPLTNDADCKNNVQQILISVNSPLAASPNTISEPNSSGNHFTIDVHLNVNCCSSTKELPTKSSFSKNQNSESLSNLATDIEPMQTSEDHSNTPHENVKCIERDALVPLPNKRDNTRSTVIQHAHNLCQNITKTALSEKNQNINKNVIQISSVNNNVNTEEILLTNQMSSGNFEENLHTSESSVGQQRTTIAAKSNKNTERLRTSSTAKEYNVDELNVANILKSSKTGRWVLKFQRNNSFLESEVRRDLVNVLIEAVHKAGIRRTKEVNEIFAKFATEIKELFPNEWEDRYYCPENGENGRLWNRFKYSGKKSNDSEKGKELSDA